MNLYGSDEEVDRFYLLMENLDNESVVEIVHLIEDIKRRNVTKIYWHCCDRCQNFNQCKINWFRGEKNIPQNCCSLCNNYEECVARMNSEQKKETSECDCGSNTEIEIETKIIIKI